jgi:hypothetical protein
MADETSRNEGEPSSPITDSTEDSPPITEEGFAHSNALYAKGDISALKPSTGSHAAHAAHAAHASTAAAPPPSPRSPTKEAAGGGDAAGVGRPFQHAWQVFTAWARETGGALRRFPSAWITGLLVAVLLVMASEVAIHFAANSNAKLQKEKDQSLVESVGLALEG